MLPDLLMVTDFCTGLRPTLSVHYANETSIEPPVVIGELTQLITAGVLSPAFTAAITASFRGWGARPGRHRIVGGRCTGGGRPRRATLIRCPA